VKILLVEDDPGISDVLEYALTAGGHQVVKTRSGREAGTLHRQAEFVILDIGLPDMDGFDVCRDIRKTSTVPVLMLTSRTEEIDRVVGLESVIKSTAAVRRSVIRSLIDLILPALLAFSLAALVAFALSSYVTGILKNLAGRAERVAAGEPGVRLETWSKSELGDLAHALEKMRIRLDGKQYVEETALTLSHEVKTPIAAIRGAAEILQQSDDPAVRQKFFANIFAEADRLSALVGNFLALSRIESAPAAPHAQSSLAGVASSVAKTFGSRAGGIRFRTEIGQAVGSVPIPADQLRRMMEALLENAFQFTPEGGCVTFVAGSGQFSVEDEGPGIPAEVRSKVFDRFFTTVNPLTGRRGTGLGLAIVKSLADRYGAMIAITCPAGTQVRVNFTQNS
jgi:two-component system sensor histidine kinase CreC